MTARAIGSGTISFGLVSIPFKVYTAASSHNLSFNLLHKKCSSRMKQQYRCPVDDEIVERTDMVKGFEFAKDQYVTFTEEELKKLDSGKLDSLEIVEFVPEKTVNPIHVEKNFYLGPDRGGDKAYQLFAKALVKSGKVAIGRYWTRGRQQVVLIRPHLKGLVLQYIYYAGEVRPFEEVAASSETAFKDIELDMAEKLISQLSSPEFKADKYRDEYQDRLRDAVDQKIAGREITLADEPPQPIILDLYEALKRSLEAS